MEPTPETYQKMGALCVAWSYLEMETEKTLLGIMSLSQELARIFVWRLGMRQRWQLIVSEGDTFLQSSDVSALKAINKKIEVVMRDRNIIIHGIVHAYKKNFTGSFMSMDELTSEHITPPCWTIFMGEGAGKRYPVSTSAVSTVLQNVQKVGEELMIINKRLDFKTSTEINSEIEHNWPKPL
jgi:hypothetical protein